MGEVSLVGLGSDNQMKKIVADLDGNLKINLIGCNMTEVDLATDADVVVSASPAILVGIYVNVVFSAHVVNILNAAATKLILPASLAAGTEKDMRNAIFADSLIVNSDDLATGKVVLFWRAIR